jgi:predicted Zn-dependent peptidase
MLRAPFSVKTNVGMSRPFSTLPLSEPFPNVPKANEGLLSAPVFTKSTTQNGVSVVTFASPKSVASVGIFIKNGSRFESSSNSGSNLVLKHLSFENKQGLTSVDFVRGLESIGATLRVSAGREITSFTSDVESNRVSTVIPQLFNALNPDLEEYHLRDNLDEIKDRVETALSDPSVYVLEKLHGEAFKTSGLGTPLYSLHNLDHLSVDDLQETAAQNLKSEIVVVAVGDVNHKEIVSLVESSSKKLATTGQASSSKKQEASSYKGGSNREWISGDRSYFALAYEGSSANSNDLAATSVLQYLLGGGRSFSKDGPGALLTSRLNRNIVEKSKGDVSLLSSFHFPYSDAGLLGVYGVVKANQATNTINLLKQEIDSLSQSIPETDFNRAKQQLKADILFNTETTASLVDYLGTNTLNKNKYATPKEFADAVDALTAQTVAAVAKRVFKTTPTLSVLGDLSSFPETK